MIREGGVTRELLEKAFHTPGVVWASHRCVHAWGGQYFEGVVYHFAHGNAGLPDKHAMRLVRHLNAQAHVEVYTAHPKATTPEAMLQEMTHDCFYGKCMGYSVPAVHKWILKGNYPPLFVQSHFTTCWEAGEDKLNRILDGQEPEPVVDPQFDMDTAQLVDFCSLLRDPAQWDYPDEPPPRIRPGRLLWDHLHRGAPVADAIQSGGGAICGSPVHSAHAVRPQLRARADQDRHGPCLAIL